MRHAILVVLFSLGCGGSTASEPTTDAGADGFSIDAAVDAPSSPSTCPASPPAEGAKCVPGPSGGPLCTYGDEIAAWCRTQLVCDLTTSTWRRLHNGSCSSECPSTTPTVRTECTGSLACAWSDGAMCVCSPGPTRLWRCEPPEADTRCPRIAPNLGTMCTTAGLTCRYTISLGCLDCRPLGYVATCVDGVWQEPR